jgi:hypothetical protein
MDDGDEDYLLEGTEEEMEIFKIWFWTKIMVIIKFNMHRIISLCYNLLSNIKNSHLK